MGIVFVSGGVARLLTGRIALCKTVLSQVFSDRHDYVEGYFFAARSRREFQGIDLPKPTGL
jgi:hypothetical protein